MRQAALACLLAALVGACAGGGERPQARAEDPALDRAMRLARVAFDGGRYDQAAALYHEAAARGEARDDALAIAEAHYGAGISHMRQDDDVAALADVKAAEAALALEKQGPFPELTLLEATVRYRLGQPELALPLAESLRGGAPVVSGRASYLLGLIAFEAGDATALNAARDRLSALDAPELAADQAELQARLELLQGRPGIAAIGFQQAAAMRRNALDYPGMTRALLAGAASAEQAADPSLAAELYLRAARSAAAREQRGAGEWLLRAASLAEQAGRPSLAREARERLRELYSASPE